MLRWFWAFFCKPRVHQEAGGRTSDVEPDACEPVPNSATVDARLAEWSQGDISSLGTFFYQESSDAQGVAASSIAVIEVAASVVVSQTCDVRRSSTGRPFVQICPVVSLPEEQRGQARGGYMPRYVALPWHSDNSFADLDRVATIEKAVLTSTERIAACPKDADGEILAHALSRYYSRFAFPEDLNKTLKRFKRRVRDKIESSGEEGVLLRSIVEIRATAEPNWEAAAIDVTLILLTDSSPLSADARAAASRVLDGWLALCEPTGQIRAVDGYLARPDQITAEDYMQSALLDLDHLS